MNQVKLLNIPSNVDSDIRKYICQISPKSKIDVAFDHQEAAKCNTLFMWDSISICGEVIKVMKSNPDVNIVVLTNNGSQSRAEDVINYGAMDYRMLPISKEIFEVYLKKSAIMSDLSNEANEASENASEIFFTKDVITKKILSKAALVAKSKASVLITGESGTGKERMSQYIHECSDRSSNKMVTVNCAAIPETMIESELFGYVKGAFTGATSDKIGKFELANNSTILLDEITEMPIDLQAKLLRVIQEGEVDRLGSTKTKKVDVRIIATSNRKIERAIEDGTFREDLFYRLSVVSVDIPPLRNRKNDVIYLAEHFLTKYSKEYGKDLPAISKEATTTLSTHTWRGNVRELENTMHRAILTCQKEVTNEDLDIDVATFPSTGSTTNTNTPVLMSIREMEKALIKETLKKVEGNRTEAAKLLGINIKTLRTKLKDIGDISR